jgi:hypothetical protein
MSEHFDENKDAPSGAPFDPAELAAKVRRAVDEPAALSEIRVSLEVEGGQHPEHYHFAFTTSGAQEAEAGLRDDLREIAVEQRRSKLTGTDLASLLKAVDVEGLVAASRVRPAIPPDSLVGRLRVGDGEREVTVLFMADREQARTAGYEPPAAVTQLVDQIYKLGAKTVGAKNIRPG